MFPVRRLYLRLRLGITKFLSIRLHVATIQLEYKIEQLSVNTKQQHATTLEDQTETTQSYQ